MSVPAVNILTCSRSARYTLIRGLGVQNEGAKRVRALEAIAPSLVRSNLFCSGAEAAWGTFSTRF